MDRKYVPVQVTVYSHRPSRQSEGCGRIALGWWLASLIGWCTLAPTSWAACSTYFGKVVVNEVYAPASGTPAVELRILDLSTIAATSNFANWQLRLYYGNASTTATANLN